MFRKHKRRALIGLSAICALAAASAAFAYFTSPGSGTATATVGSASTVTLKATVTGSLYPGTASTVTFSVDNASAGKQRVGAISLEKITPDVGHAACSTVTTGATPDFTMTEVAVNKVYGPGNGQAVTPTGSLAMNDTGVSQDACQGATLTLSLKSS